MFKVSTLSIFLSALLLASPTFADMDETASPDCETIVQACLNAGYVRDGGAGKMFWGDCMKPIMLGNTVTGVTVDAKTATSCRDAKIVDLQNLLKELQAVTPPPTPPTA